MDVAKTLAEMAIELEQAGDPDTVLDQVSHYARLVLGADDAGVLRTHSRSSIETPAATSDVVHRAHRLQAELDEGPCLDAIEGRATYVANDVRADPRWPQWGPAAADIGVLSAVGVRLATRDRGYGSLNIYARRVDAFTDRDAEVAEMLAAHATAAFAAAHEAQGLRTALDSRSIIGQAQGILMQKFDIDSGAAFEFLKRVSQHENQKLVNLAEAIVVQRDANARPAKPGEASQTT
ncbi:GAF and ANTAR domain-containing protein [Aeromicrobium sp.]|uniref:GAF and ANTAR domain-containing protein n=1 Tax=Aeromicrobium sp. TaxID=1871063 RepID=UPI0025BFC72D|nr:GAF and ANTAR domain-containing protein [Aeromicrobium sp.]MCK5892330.1 GAF and ANTAR domain-containing protein [Aeromicrobium sp.]